MNELDRRLKVTDGLMRHLIVRVDEDQSKAERARTKRHEESRRRRIARGLPPDGSRVRDRSTTTGMTIGDDSRMGRRCSHGIWTEAERTGRRTRRRAGATKGDDAKGGQRRGLFRRSKVCKFCADKIDDINYKDVKLLSGFVPERGKVLPRRISGTCAKHQRGLRIAIVRARQLALLPYVTE